MAQIVELFSTKSSGGTNVADEIMDFLQQNPGTKVDAIYTIIEDHPGYSTNSVLVVFKTD